MARLFDGIDDSLQSPSTIDLSAYTKITIAFWLWWNSYANDDDLALEFSANYGLTAGAFIVDPNDPSGTVVLGVHGNLGFNTVSFTRPGSSAWHHWTVVLDMTQAVAEVSAVYIDGVAQSLTPVSTVNNTGSFANDTLNVMSRNNASFFGAGRWAEIAIWGDYLFTQTDVNNLYNGGNGRLATDIQDSKLPHYWRILGNESPEPPTKGAISLIVNGAVQVAHPFALSKRVPSIPTIAGGL
jgi:hypothetical protein